jgi:hypothetical protein
MGQAGCAFGNRKAMALPDLAKTGQKIFEVKAF